MAEHVAPGVPASPLTLSPGATAWVVAPGPSTADAVVMGLPGQAMIAVGGAYSLVPQAAAVYCADAPWWRHYTASVQAQTIARRFVASPPQSTLADIVAMGVEPVLGFHRPGPTPRPRHYIHFGGPGCGANSGAQAIDLAHCWGARRIILVGFDLADVDGRRYACARPPDALWRQDPLWQAKRAVVNAVCFGLAGAGVEILNTSPVSQIVGTTPCRLADVLAGARHHAA